MTITASILVTDVVGSTDVRARLGEDRAEALRRRHDRMLADAVAHHSGTLVKSTGDGVLALFAGAADALAAAVEAQRVTDAHTRRNPDEPLVIRAGLAAGDVTVEDDDCFGTPVIQAARLCSAAGAGQILTAEIVRSLAGGRGNHVFESVGSLDLKGLPEPLPTLSIDWRSSIGSTSVRLPVALSTPSSLTFAGREDAWQTLESAWADAARGFAQAVLLAGEPGIGKTRLCAELARVVADDLGIVVYGGCDADVDLPYRPVADALSQLVRQIDRDVVDEHLAERGHALASLVDAIDEQAEKHIGEPAKEREQLFDAVVDLFRRASARTPVLLVLDDLHWADGSSLRLLTHVVRHRAGMHLLVVATYRDTDVDRSHPLSSALADLRRDLEIPRISLDGLDADAIAHALTATGGHVADGGGGFAARLHADTGGNPLFVGEIMRHLVESGVIFQADGHWTADDAGLDRIGVPEGVRDVFGRRLSALPPEVSDVLRVAAVIGVEFDATVVADVADHDVVTVLDVLDTAGQRGLVIAGDRPGRWRFSHAILRQTLLEEISLGTRLRLHHRAGAVLEQAGADCATVAHHFCEAAVVADADKACVLARQAGDEASASYAWEQAIRWYERASRLTSSRRRTTCAAAGCS